MFGSGFLRGVVIASAGLMLSACVVVEPGPGRPLPPTGPGGPPQACTFEYAPVCARRGGDQRTFSNACMARVEGYRVVSPGECRRAGPGPGRPPQACTREYRPVCATDGRRLQTFGNACTARAEGFRIVSQGECRMSRPRG